MQGRQKKFAAVSDEKILTNSATLSVADTLPCLVQERGFLLKVELLVVGEIDAGHLLIIKISMSIRDYESRVAKQKKNVCKQLIYKYNITLISAVVTFGQICNV